MLLMMIIIKGGGPGRVNVKGETAVDTIKMKKSHPKKSVRNLIVIRKKVS